MTLAPHAVLRAAHAALTADAALLDLLGGAHVFEHIPARARPPYLALAVPVARDWSTATEEGAQVELTVTTYCEASVLSRLAAIQARVAAALAFGNAALADALADGGHALVNLVPLDTTTERRPADELLVGVQRLTLVTEPE